MKIKMMSTNREYVVEKVCVFTPKTKDVNQLNDPIARANQKSRLKELRSREKAGKSMTKHSKLKDVKQRVQMEANSKFSKNMKGR